MAEEMSVSEEITAIKARRQRLSIDQRLARLEAQKQRLLAQRNKRSRQLETREKIIVGAAVLNAMREDAGWRQRVSALLRENVTRDIDRDVIAEWLSPTSTLP